MRHIDGIKTNFILADPDQLVFVIVDVTCFVTSICHCVVVIVRDLSSQVRARAFKSIQWLEQDINSLYRLQLKYLNKQQQQQTTTDSHTPTSSDTFKHIDKLVNQAPLGLYRASELGEPMRLHIYLSPLDLIEHEQQQQQQKQQHHRSTSGNGLSVTYTALSSTSLDDIVRSNLGATLTISILSGQQQQQESSQEPSPAYMLPDCATLAIDESDDERTLHDYLSPYMNVNFNFERFVSRQHLPLFPIRMYH